MAELLKDCLYPGVVYPQGFDEPVTFLPEDVRYYTERMSDMLKDGLQIPTTWEHQETCEQPLTKEEWARRKAEEVQLTCGYAKEAFLDPDTECLNAKVEFDDEEDARKARKTRYISPAIRWNVKDGHNKLWPGPSIVALAITNRPVQHRQNSFRPISLSLIRDKFLAGQGPALPPPGGRLVLSLLDYVLLGDIRLAKEASCSYTAQDADLGADAKRQKSLYGRNPADWVADEGKWDEAKKAARKTYSEESEAFWPVVVSIYKKMGGKVNKKTQMSLENATMDDDKTKGGETPPPREGKTEGKPKGKVEGKTGEHEHVRKLVDALAAFEIPIVLEPDTDKSNIMERLCTALYALNGKKNPPGGPMATTPNTTPPPGGTTPQTPREVPGSAGYLMSLNAEGQEYFKKMELSLAKSDQENKALKEEIAKIQGDRAREKKESRKADLEKRANALLLSVGAGLAQPLVDELKAVNLSQEGDHDRKMDLLEARIDTLEKLAKDPTYNAAQRFGLGDKPRPAGNLPDPANPPKKELDPHVMGRLTRGRYTPPVKT